MSLLQEIEQHGLADCEFNRTLLGDQTMRDELVKTYLDYINNYLTVEKYAEHNGLHVDQAEKLLALSRQVFHSPHPEQ